MTRENRSVSTDQTERVGVEAVRLLFAELGWFVREPARPDYGVDLFVETSDGGRPSGRLLAVQVKSGTSYVGRGDADMTFRADQRHIDYWMNHSLPVVLVLYDPEQRQAYWQAVTAQTAEPTGKGWKFVVPRTQTLTADARGPLSVLAAEGPTRATPEAEVLARLRADLTWMQVLESGGSVFLEAQEWINKTSGRGDLLLIAEPRDGRRVERSFTVFLGLLPYEEALPLLFPWAELEADEDALYAHDHDEWMDETGIWDSEEKRYIGNVETFADWRRDRYPDDTIRPCGEEAGEVALWRLSLTLNDLGRGILALEHLLSGS